MQTQRLLVRALSASGLSTGLFLAVLEASAYDFNLDWNTDMIWRKPSADVNSIWRMPQMKWFHSSVSYSGTNLVSYSSVPNYLIVATADFNRDGFTDLLFRNVSSRDNVIWFMIGMNVNSATPIGYGGTDWYVVGTGDFNGDGYPDILWRNPTTDDTGAWFMQGGTRIGTGFMQRYGVPSAWTARIVADFNNDGWPDIYWQNDIDRATAIWYLKGLKLVTTTPSLYPGSSGWVAAASGQFNVVGNSDIIWRHTTGQNHLWIMRNAAWTQSIALPSMPADWQIGGTSPGENVLELCATNVSASTLVLNWRLGNGVPVTIQRRVYDPTNQGSWDTLATNYKPYSWTNTLTVGQRYEYKVGNEYLLTAINGAPVEHRGKVILVVANNVTNFLATELEVLRTNLVGDGWTVVRTNVPPHNDANWSSNTNAIVSIRNFISNTWSNSPATNRPRAALLIGHVPIPYSGHSNNPDGHGARNLPADGYYGDVDGIWTDNTFYSCGLQCNPQLDCSCGPCGDPRFVNNIGDGKWDQSSWPANSQGVAGLEVAVGRIDFANLEAFRTNVLVQKSDTNLLRQYLNKDDRYRRKVVPQLLQERVMVGTYFAHIDQTMTGIRSGIRTGTRLFGFAPEKIVNGDGFYPQNGCTWAIHGGRGGAWHVEGYNDLFHSTSIAEPGDVSFITPGNEPQVGFFCLHGSCFIDIDYKDNLLRSVIAVGTDYNLGAMWFHSDHVPLQFEQTALGETVGSGFLRSANGALNILGNTYLAWMGDPTLRLQVLAPPTGLTATPSGSNVNLAWTGSPETSQYFVYRSTNSLGGPFVRISTGVISTTSYTDTSPPSGAKTYMVRALKLTTTASGSYTNLSQGIFANSN